MKKYVSNQSGRSMIEMLGVLAIVGVLSVAGIAGYSKAMAKYKTNKLIDQVSTVAANVRTTFAGQGNYKGLDSEVAYHLGIYPEEMTKDCAKGFDISCVRTSFGGYVDIVAVELYINGFSGKEGDTFSFAVGGFNKETCSSLAALDWGADAVGIVGGEGFADDPELLGSMLLDDNLIYSISDIKENRMDAISKICGTCNNAENRCAVGWVFR